MAFGSPYATPRTPTKITVSEYKLPEYRDGETVYGVGVLNVTAAEVTLIKQFAEKLAGRRNAKKPDFDAKLKLKAGGRLYGSKQVNAYLEAEELENWDDGFPEEEGDYTGTDAQRLETRVRYERSMRKRAEAEAEALAKRNGTWTPSPPRASPGQVDPNNRFGGIDFDEDSTNDKT